jgi:hypothetical protein
MRFQAIPLNPAFIGRSREIQRLNTACQPATATIIVVSGRRRVGKTELIEQYFRNMQVLKFEGIQTDPPRGRERQTAVRRQIDACLHRLQSYQWDVPPHREFPNWTSFFEFISPVIAAQPIVLYLEEIQWLSSYRDDFLAELKPFWDDSWRHNPKLRIVISGSAPSFIASQFMSNKAIYNRSDHHIKLAPFSPSEVAQMLPKRGIQEQLIASLVFGGIPGYLKRIPHEKSLLETIALECFSSDGYFVEEYDRIFISSMANSAHYRHIIDTLSKRGPLSRSELARMVTGSETIGGEFSKVLHDLVQSAFIEEYSSIHTPNAKNLKRYRLADPFLHFYQRLILPRIGDIKKGRFDGNPREAIQERELAAFLGHSFERWGRQNVASIARLLGFPGVSYREGSFFHRGERGFQIDLLIERADHTLIVAECKYATAPLKSSIANDIDDKIDRMLEAFPKYRGFTIRKLLLVSDSSLVPQTLRDRFDFLLSAKDIFELS